ncbi:MAG: D-isomer specific 2-hydroxyacid dehydrogenase family protein [Ignisphaera sp.]|nr:D-isomer specific 2-hydroxyacid dehydrogenase family protein [Ignisphaera sp.]MCX8168386.1 D-isomer specific 2-hydroxyacid dehydrogenase family protein [Ignisphaera sp.]MDW8085782.1 D-isomer specific 2-hydroxyacid dehydrogenase family protein [Ignisphaera sp.]
MVIKIAIVNSKSFGAYTNAVDRLRRVGEIIRIDVPRDISGTELAEKLKGVHFIVASVTPFYTREFFENNKDVVMIVRHGIGYDNIDVKAAEEHGVIVARVPGWREREAVAELTIALMLAAIRRVVESSNSVRAGKWHERAKYVGKELPSLTIGVVGFGNIGSRVAAILINGFNSKVIVYDPYVPRAYVERLGCVYAESVDELLAQSDVITLHAILTDETRHMINREAFEKMKDGVIIVNTARGELIDTQALIEYIEKGKIAAAALDVIEGEPIDEKHPLLKYQNVIVTPHIGAYTYESLVGMDEAVVEAIDNYLNNKPIDGIVIMPRERRALRVN